MVSAVRRVTPSDASSAFLSPAAHMPIAVKAVTPADKSRTLSMSEGHFLDFKAKEIRPIKLAKSLSAFANADGGELYVGIRERPITREPLWEGFRDVENANGHIQALESFFPLGRDFLYEFLDPADGSGLILRIEVLKTQSIRPDAEGSIYIRRGAQNLPVDTPEKLKQLEFAKGLASFESEMTTASVEEVANSETIIEFALQVVPSAEPEAWLRKQQLIRDEHATVAGVLLFADEPQVYLAKRSGVKITRYKTAEPEGFREAMAFTPLTVEGSLYSQIHATISKTVEIIQEIPRLGDAQLEAISYPREALHEIITNAILHRDYSITDDVHVRIFDNRVEVESPGKLPGHVTVKNILRERFARNGSLVRILNKYPDPPNKDVGEGLNTAFTAMTSLGLKEPIIDERENSVRVTIRHEPLATPEHTILEYLATNASIGNTKAREICHIRQDHQMKVIFNRLVDRGLIEKVPGTNTSTTAYQLRRTERASSE
jgi:ATP-dependent DNA helicase RecG